MASDGKDDDRVREEAPGRYDEELLSANWNPAIDLLEASTGGGSHSSPRASAEALREEDVDAFLGRIYTLGG